MSKSLSSAEVHRLIAEELDRLYMRRASYWDAVEPAPVRRQEPVPTCTLYKPAPGKMRLAATPQDSTKMAHERARLFAQISSVVRSRGPK